MSATRFRFGLFLVSPAHRSIRCGDVDVALIPRYFDLLVLLLGQRDRVVTRQEIFDRVWTDVIVSDGALSQAIRTIRRCLDDDPREPRFIRTVARHGYQFVGTGVVEEADDGPLPPTMASESERRSGVLEAVAAADAAADLSDTRAADPVPVLLDRLLRRPPFTVATDEERREAAEQLHAVGTSEVLRRLDGLPGQAEARAILRDARWDVPGAGDVALLRSPQPWTAIRALVLLRLHRAARHMSNRWGAAATGGVVAGIVAGTAGGVALWLVPESHAQPNVILALAVVGALAGALGAAGVGAGLATAEALARSSRTAGLVFCGAIGGALAGTIGHVLARAVLAGVFGRDLPVGGWVEGLVIGGAAGFGYAWSTSPLPGGGLAAPRGWARIKTALLTGLACAIAGVVLTMSGRHLVASSLDAMASAFDGSNVGLAPVARLLGEGGLRPITQTLVSAFEAMLFGAGLAFGLTHRPGRD